MPDNLITDKLLNFDALDTAEKMTGKSYKEDKGTSDLGMGIFLMHNQEKKERLIQACDTYRSQGIDDYMKVIDGIGFYKVYEEEFVDKCDQQERYFIFFHDKGIILKFDTYNGERVNGGSFDYNFRYSPGLKSRPTFESSCFFSDKTERLDHVMIASCAEVWDGMRFRVGRLLNGECGKLLNPWIEPYHCFGLGLYRKFGEYNEENKNKTHEHHVQIVAQLPDNVKRCCLLVA